MTAVFFALAYEARLVHAYSTMQRVDAKKEGLLQGWREKGRRRNEQANLKTVVVTPGAEQAQTRSPFWRHRQVQADLASSSRRAPLALAPFLCFPPSFASFSASSSRTRV